MKLSFFLILFSIFPIFAQDGISVKVPDDTVTDYSSGHSPLILESTIISELAVNFSIVNTTGTNQAWRVIRWQEENVPATWTDAVCFGINCFNPSTDNPWCSSAVPQNALIINNNSSTSLYFHATPDSYAIANYKLYIGTDCDNLLDSISIQVNYLTNGINQLNPANTLKLYPNPANEFVSIEYEQTDTGILKLIDILGNIIYSEPINMNSKINTSELKNGIYFVQLEFDERNTSFGKIMVKH